MISRRRFLRTVSVSLLAAPLAAEAQQAGRVHQIGVLSGGKNAQTDACLESLREGLRELGYVEGRTHVLTVRWSDGQDAEFPHLAADLVNRKVDVIVSLSSGAHPAVKTVTSTIPIVMAASSYPVEEGVIRSLAHPGGNVTGLTGLTPELIAKRLQLLKEAVPGATRVAILRLPGRLQTAMVKDLTTAGRQLGIELLLLEVQSADDLPSAFAQAANRRVDAVMTTQAPFFAFEATRIAELALKHRLPGLSGESGAPAAGMLMFYGSNTPRNCGRAAVYVDKILKGAKPADLPVEQPTKFELVVNLKTAKALGLTLPPSLLLRADQVIACPEKAGTSSGC